MKGEPWNSYEGCSTKVIKMTTSSLVSHIKKGQAVFIIKVYFYMRIKFHLLIVKNKICSLVQIPETLISGINVYLNKQKYISFHV